MIKKVDLPYLNHASQSVRLADPGRPALSGPLLGRVSSGEDGGTEQILRRPLRKFGRGLILECPVRATLIVFPPPGFNPCLGFMKRLEPVHVEAFPSERRIEGFHMGVVRGLSGS